MKFLSTFKITKGFDTWLKMYKEIEPDLGSNSKIPKDMCQKQSNFGMYLTRNNLDKNSKQWDK